MAKFIKEQLWDVNDEPIKLRRGEVFVAFMKFKKRLFAMTTQQIYEIKEVK